MHEGKIKNLIYNHHDDVDGWKLHDGTLVHFPPHIGHELCLWIGEEDQVFIEGEFYTNRNGDQVLFPHYIESQGWSLSFEQKRPHHPPGPESHESARQDKNDITNADLMRELKKIRRMLETLVGP